MEVAAACCTALYQESDSAAVSKTSVSCLSLHHKVKLVNTKNKSPTTRQARQRHTNHTVHTYRPGHRRENPLPAYCSANTTCGLPFFKRSEENFALDFALGTVSELEDADASSLLTVALLWHTEHDAVQTGHDGDKKCGVRAKRDECDSTGQQATYVDNFRAPRKRLAGALVVHSNTSLNKNTCVGLTLVVRRCSAPSPVDTREGKKDKETKANR